MSVMLPELEERVHLNGDGEGQTFGRNEQGRIVVFTGDGDHSNGGWWDCFYQFWDAMGDFWGCSGLFLMV